MDGRGETLSIFYTSAICRNDHVLVRGYRNGQKFRTREAYQPYVFVPDRGPSPSYHTLDGEPVKKHVFEGLKKARDFLRDKAENQLLYGIDAFEYLWIYDTFPNGVQADLDIVDIASIDLEAAKGENGRYASPDIADQPITAITVEYFGDGKVYAFGCGDYWPEDDTVIYQKCESEEQMLKAFLALWMSRYPDIVTGWNTDGYDLGYLYNRIKNVLGESTAKELSPWKTIIVKERGDRKTYVYLGISSLDYLRLYRNQKFFLPPQESYTLDNIAFVELGERKVDYSEFRDLQDLYKRDFPKFMRYNIKDTRLIGRLEDKLGLIRLTMTVAYASGVNFEDIFGSVRQWEVLCHNYLRKYSIVMPWKSGAVKEDLIGGYVKLPHTGLKKWIVSFDLDSLYSHIEMGLNISPETYVGQLDPELEYMTPEAKIDFVLNGGLDKYRDEIRKRDVCVAGNLACYTRKKKGFLPVLLENMFNERVENKKRATEAKKKLEAYLKENGIKEDDRTDQGKKDIEKEIARFHNAQMAGKVNLNSVYGCLSNEYFRFFNNRNAEAITTSGQVAVQWAGRAVNDYLNKVLGTEDDYIVASDTDSIYVNLGPLVEKFIPFANGSYLSQEQQLSFVDQTVKKKLDGIIIDSYKKLADYNNAISQKMHMKRESIAARAVWTAKKHYAMTVLDKEGVRYAQPKVEVKGIEVVRSSTPKVVRDKLKAAIKIILTGTEPELHSFITEFRDEFVQLPFEDVAFPRGISGMDDYSDSDGNPTKGCPIQVYGALVYNKLLDEEKVIGFQPVVEGDKAKFCYLRFPNPAHSHVITTPGLLPKELGLDPYLDKHAQFEKSFEAPLSKLVNAVGWQMETNLESMFT